MTDYTKEERLSFNAMAVPTPAWITDEMIKAGTFEEHFVRRFDAELSESVLLQTTPSGAVALTAYGILGRTQTAFIDFDTALRLGLALIDARNHIVNQIEGYQSE